MKPLDRRGRAMFARAARSLGGKATITLRRRHSLLDTTVDKPATTLLLDGAHLEGATTLQLKSAGLAGSLLPKLRLTADGEDYEVTAEARAAGHKLVVTVTPGLVSNLADETPVTVEPFRDFTFRRLAGRQTAELQDRSTATGEQTYLLSTQGAETEPRPDDLLVVGSLPEEIDDVQPVAPGDVPWGWRVRRSGRAA